jgi:hypothetical protein
MADLLDKGELIWNKFKNSPNTARVFRDLEVIKTEINGWAKTETKHTVKAIPAELSGYGVSGVRFDADVIAMSTDFCKYLRSDLNTEINMGQTVFFEGVEYTVVGSKKDKSRLFNVLALKAIG